MHNRLVFFWPKYNFMPSTCVTRVVNQSSTPDCTHKIKYYIRLGTHREAHNPATVYSNLFRKSNERLPYICRAGSPSQS